MSSNELSDRSDHDSTSPTPIVLVVGDNPECVANLVGIVRSVLADWSIQSATNEVQAYEMIDKLHGQIETAVVNLHLDQNEDDSGIRVLRRLQDSEPNSYRVLVSFCAKDRDKVYDAVVNENPRLVESKVSLRYIDADPVSELQSALFDARRRFEN